jgi:UDP-N-acetylglucosamine--N-acetylmuramyl-(pentapeptide) pyrophosphoryl-undecaprenol N-acetylglucosamine transferase
MTVTGDAVLWYVHHHGTGHWRQATAVARRLARPVVFASTRQPSVPLRDGDCWVRLTGDLAPVPRDPTAGGRLHWAPIGHHGLLARHRQLLTLAADVAPAVAVVDVSVEVAVLLRLSGIPLVSVRMPGHRDDAAHRLGFDVSDVVIAPVPAWLDLVPCLPSTRHVGFVSNIAPRPRPWQAGGPVVVLTGTGGSRLDLDRAAALARRLPGRLIQLVGTGAGQETGHRAPANLRTTGWVDDPEPILSQASVVVGNAGVGTVADVIATGRPLVVVPEARPFGEQAATAEALDRAGLAGVVEDPRDVDALIGAISTAERRGPADVRLAGGAASFAALVDHLACRHALVGVS